MPTTSARQRISRLRRSGEPDLRQLVGHGVKHPVELGVDRGGVGDLQSQDSRRPSALAPEGSWPASAGNDGKVRIWDPSTGATRHTLTGHGGEGVGVGGAPDGSWLAPAA